MPPLPNQEEPIKLLENIVNAFLSRPDAGPFSEPVDWRQLELFDYPEIIKEPMDLGTVKRRIERGHYDTAAQCADDIRLVWRNCMEYNQEGSDFWLLGKAFARRFEDRYRKIKLSYDVGEIEEYEDETEEENEFQEAEVADDSNPNQRTSMSKPTLDARAQLGADLMLLQGPDWGHIVSVLQKKCPKALEKEPKLPGHIEILLDDLDANVFREISEYVADKASNRKRGIDEVPIEDITGKRSKKKK